MHDRELPGVVERLERREPRVHPEEAVEIERRFGRGSGPRDRDARPRRVVVALAEWHDHVEAVDGAALEDRHEDFAPWGGFSDGAREKLRREAQAHERQPAVLQEYSSRDHGVLPSLEFR